MTDIENQEQETQLPQHSNDFNNRRIAKNTIFLYIRMGLSVIVSLYTSRIVLQTLGVDDYGIYSLVGGIVVVFQFINSSLSGATSRFLTYELGKGNIQRLKDTFSTALIAHLFIALVVFVIAETVGLWFLNTQLVIPEVRHFAAQIVYQCSILSLMISFTQVPYNASIISHEDMNIFAYIELLAVFLRLGIVFLLLIGNIDKLILYALLVLIVSILIATLYRVYAISHYQECHFQVIWKPEILKPMLSFSGWNLYGKAAASIRQFGTNSIINIFCGVMYNAAGGIALTIHGTLSSFFSNVNTAFRPQIIKQYACGNYSLMNQLMMNACKYGLLLFLAIALPLFFELPYVLQIWLGIVPDKTVEFVRWLIWASIPFAISEIISIGIDATGKVKYLYLCQGTISLCTLIPTYILLRNNYDVSDAYICILVQRCIIVICNIILLKALLKSFSIKMVITQLLKDVVLISIIVYLTLIWLQIQITNDAIELIATFIVSFMFFGLYTYFVVIDRTTRNFINLKFKNYYIR